MTPSTEEKPFLIDNGPEQLEKKKERQRKPAPAPTTEPDQKPRRIARRNTVDRKYYLCTMSSLGGIANMLADFPTIGQARKGKPLTCKVAGVPLDQLKIVRTFIVE